MCDIFFGLFGFKWLECGSFVSVVGFIESFYIVRFGGGVLKFGGVSSNDGSDYDLESNYLCNNKLYVLLIFSLFVDVICVVNCLMVFVCYLCKIFCLDEIF